jgi:hypothetical protein
VSAVSGSILVPRPAAKMTAFIIILKLRKI